ncbi:unnamed protein product, partial [marine sediment metagenome]
MEAYMAGSGKIEAEKDQGKNNKAESLQKKDRRTREVMRN